MTTISILNHKGGVGKTTIAVNFSAALARRGHKVLLVDMDTQNQVIVSITRASAESPGIGEVMLRNHPIHTVILESEEPGVFVVPAGQKLRDFQSELFSKAMADSRLSLALSKVSGFDYCVIDHGPGSSILTTNGLLASRWLVSPIAADMLSLHGVRMLINTFELVEEVHENLSFLGTVINMWDARIALSKTVESQLEKRSGVGLFETKIRTNSGLRELPLMRLSAFEARNKRAIEDFNSLTDEILERINEQEA